MMNIAYIIVYLFNFWFIGITVVYGRDFLNNFLNEKYNNFVKWFMLVSVWICLAAIPMFYTYFINLYINLRKDIEQHKINIEKKELKFRKLHEVEQGPSV